MLGYHFIHSCGYGRHVCGLLLGYGSEKAVDIGTVRVAQTVARQTVIANGQFQGLSIIIGRWHLMSIGLALDSRGLIISFN